MTQEQANRFINQCNAAMNDFVSGNTQNAIDRLEMLVIYFQELMKEGRN